MSAPNDIMKSTYSLPSASHTCDPSPRSRKIGPGVYTVAPREGEFTPSTSDCWARSNHCSDRLRFKAGLVSILFVGFIFEIRFVLSVRQPPAIHHQRRARHERRIVRGQK